LFSSEVEEGKMATRKINYLLWFSALALILACVPSIGSQIPTADPNQINQFIAQTANAAATQTVAAMPTSTHTSTPTETPENTSTASPTYTSTVIFILSTPTKPVPPTFTGVPGGGTSGTSSDTYACQVISVDPPNGTTFGSRTDFDATWRVKNIGKRTWDKSEVDYAYESGTKIQKVDLYDLSSNVISGGTTNIVVDMVAPKNPGSYTTTWVLRNTNKVFCKFSLTINVN
jgi:hypothetical protein